MFFALLTILIMTFFTIVCKPFEPRSKRIKTKMNSWRKVVYWNGYLRFLIEGCLEIFIGIFLNWLSKRELNEGFLTEWNDRFQITNNVFVIVFAIVFLTLPFFMVSFYLRNFEKWEDEDFEEKYGCFYEDIRKDSKLSIFFTLFFVLRRVVFVLSFALTETFMI